MLAPPGIVFILLLTFLLLLAHRLLPMILLESLLLLTSMLLLVSQLLFVFLLLLPSIPGVPAVAAFHAVVGVVYVVVSIPTLCTRPCFSPSYLLFVWLYTSVGIITYTHTHALSPHRSLPTGRTPDLYYKTELFQLPYWTIKRIIPDRRRYIETSDL
jgi:hypothetical protein